MRRTKIICTIGPACQDEQTLTELCKAGMNVARLNFSHGTYESHKKLIDTIKLVREKLNLPIPIMLDTKGPEYRIGTFKGDRATVCEGDEFTFTANDIEGDNTIVSVSYKDFARQMSIGDYILVNNGLTVFRVKRTGEDYVTCDVISGGVLSNKKSMAFPDKVLEQVFLSEQDKRDLLFGIENGVDYVACSFVSNKQNVMDIRSFLNENGGEGIDIIAKIENSSGVDNSYDICSACEGIMVARGDLGVEIPFEKLPEIQKSLITTCRIRGRRVITATEMLESMIYNPRPTRAEISDVANAVYDGTSAVMLSGETAVGKYPVQAVKAMDAILKEAEKAIHYKKLFFNTDFKIENTTDAVTHSACSMALSVHAKAITVCTMTGRSARMVSRFRPDIDIIGLTADEKAWRKLSLSWGIIPVLCDEVYSPEIMFYEGAKATARTLGLPKGETVVIVGSTVSGKSGNTNSIRLETL